VFSRGNNQQQIFDDALRDVFLFQLDVVARAFGWFVYAWALMSNHFHLLLEITDLGLARGMHRLNYALAVASNARFDRINHCVGDRYSNKPIEDDTHFVDALRYIVWNPVRAGVAAHPADSTWTSYRASVGLEQAPRALSIGRLLQFFGATPEAAFRVLRASLETDVR